MIHPLFAKGEWCNGNTWVSKTFVEGSNPSSPAKQKARESVDSGLFVYALIFQAAAVG